MAMYVAATTRNILVRMLFNTATTWRAQYMRNKIRRAKKIATM